MQRGTIGAAIGARVDYERSPLPVDPTWDHDRDSARGPSWGTRRPVTARQIEAMADAEYEARTTGGYLYGVCATCNMAMSANGGCDCTDGAGRGDTARLLATLGLA